MQARLPSPHRLMPLLALLIALAAGGVCALRLVADESGGPQATPGASKPRLRREGTQLHDEPGRFTLAGNRATFVAVDGTNYAGLENLNLERVAKIIAASPDSVEWLVTGTVTEYEGSNYLLISRARRKAATGKVPRSF